MYKCKTFVNRNDTTTELTRTDVEHVSTMSNPTSTSGTRPTRKEEEKVANAEESRKEIKKKV